MASIDATERNNQINESQQTRDSADVRDKETATRHKRELAELKSHHQEAMTKLKKDYDHEISALRVSSREALTSKDKQHLKSIQDMQDVNRKRFEKVKDEGDEKYEITKANLESELGMARDKDQSDQKRLTKQFDGEIEQRDVDGNKTEAKNRESSQGALKEQAKRMNEKFDDERHYYQGYIREKDRKNFQSLTTLNRERAQEVGDLKAKNNMDRSNLDAKYQNSLNRESANYNKSVENLEQDFQHGITENKEKFKARGDQLDDQYHDNFESLKGSVNKRVNDEVNAARRENLNLREEKEIGKHDEIRKKNREKGDLTDEFQKNYSELENRRIEAVKDSQREKTKDIGELHREKDKEFRQIKSKYEEKLTEQELRTSGQFDGEIIQANRQRDLQKIQGDRQNKKLYEVFSDSTVAQTNFHEDQMDMVKKNNERMMGETRVNMEKTRTDELSKVQSQLAKESVAHQEKLVDTVSGYERQITGIRGDYEKKLRRQAELFRDQTTKQVKGMQLDRETSEQKLNARLGQMKESYEHELDQLRKRQLQERQDLALKKS
jgi:hypothetical protein